MRAIQLAMVSAAIFASGVSVGPALASAGTPTPQATVTQVAPQTPQAAGTPTPGTPPDTSATPTSQPTSPIDFGPTVPGGPTSFIPTVAAEPSLLRLVLVDYALSPTPINFRGPVTLIGHDAGTACQYRIELSPAQATTLFTTGELELTLPARCGLVELTYRAVGMVPTMDCPAGQEICKREEVTDQSIYFTLEGSRYLTGSYRVLPSGGYELPATGTRGPQTTAGAYGWIILIGFAAVSLGLISLRVRRR